MCEPLHGGWSVCCRLMGVGASGTVLNTIWSNIIRIQPNTPEDGHIDARNM